MFRFAVRSVFELAARLRGRDCLRAPPVLLGNTGITWKSVSEYLDISGKPTMHTRTTVKAREAKDTYH